jgi:hypothetical protein
MRAATATARRPVLTRLLRPTLREDSEAMGDMLESFTRWLFLEWMPVVCFHEQYETNYAKRLKIPGLHLKVNQMLRNL